MSATLTRLALAQSRLSEYFSAKELAMQIGGDEDLWPLILVKELIDNALDASEPHGPPLIAVEVQSDHFRVADNGPGLPEEILVGSLDYSQRISTKAAYVSPTRGRLGNALKVLWAAPFVASGHQPVTLTVDTPQRRHRIHVTYDAIRQQPTLAYTQEPPTVKNGTSVTVPYAGLASFLEEGGKRPFFRLFAATVAGNPHATLRWRIGEEQGQFAATAPGWRKWTDDRPTPVQWYTFDQFIAYLAAHLANGQEAMTLRQFVARFAGLTSTLKQKDVVQTAAAGAVLNDLVNQGEIDRTAARRLYQAMSAASTPPKPSALGVIGKEHLQAWMRARGELMHDSFHYRKGECLLQLGTATKPVVIEIGFGVIRDAHRLDLVELVNWSAPIGAPLRAATSDYLSQASIEPHDPVALIMAVALADARFSDHGKARLELPSVIQAKLGELLLAATKGWTRFKLKLKREERASTRRYQREKALAKRTVLTAKEACELPGLMEAAYLKASGNGQYPANARQIMYAIRPALIERMGKEQPWKNDATFTQGILPDYIAHHPVETAHWDVVYDDRGHFDEPFTRIGIGLGTVAVRNYIRMWGSNEPAPDIATGWQAEKLVPTAGPTNRYRYALFIEKEGFASLLKKAKFAERYDLAIFSTKGMSVTAARTLVEALSQVGVVILALHDYDKAGIKIRHTLGNDTRRYRFTIRPEVIDVGLRLEDIQAMALPAEPVVYGTHKDPREDILASGGSLADAAFLVDDGEPGYWTGQRVELNAMTSAQFVTWLDRRLTELGIAKVIPEEKVLANAYIRAQRLQKLDGKISTIIQAINDEAIDVPPDLTRRIKETLVLDSELSWDEAITVLVEASHAGQGRDAA